jgi:hypothetical protein
MEYQDMRSMQRDGSKSILIIREHIILKNLWEYYITTSEHINSDIQYAVVVGFEIEYGTVSLNWVKPYIITKTKDLSKIMPAIGYHWVD